MNQLKTDYVDAVFSGNRKYTEITNADDTVSFTDETAYTQTGDKFGATDINATNGAINKMARTKTATLPANGWTGSSAPYYNTVMISGISSTDSPIVSLYLANNTTAANSKALRKAWSFINNIVTSDTGIRAYANTKPTVDLPIIIKGA